VVALSDTTSAVLLKTAFRERGGCFIRREEVELRGS
jgi:hypothetical protein